MRHHPMILLPFLLAGLSEARDTGGSGGSAPSPLVSLKPDVVRPLQDVELQACVVNENARPSSHGVRPGDEVSWSFSGGDLLECVGVQVVGASPEWMDSELECQVDGGELIVRYVGVERDWAHGEGACASVRYRSPERSVSVTVSHSVRNGRWAPLSPSVVVLNVEDAGPAGLPGATGPTGPAGPIGPPGLSGAGTATVVSSTAAVTAQWMGPPVPIPGLEADVSTSAGSRFLMTVDVHALWCPGTPLEDYVRPEVWLEVDGTVVAKSRFEKHGSHSNVDPDANWSATTLTSPLDAGSHHVVALFFAGRSLAARADTACVGIPSPESLQSRLSIVEIRQAP